MAETILTEYLVHPVFGMISEVAAATGIRAYVIGGYVRDCFLGRPCNDVDIVVEGSGIGFAEEVGKYISGHEHRDCKVSYFKNFGTAMLHWRSIEVEFVGARKESYRRESRKPIVENGSLKDDQLRRDFTINAMALSLNKEDYGALLDPFGGVRDLIAGIIRTPLEPCQTYSDDPLRMLRAIRFATTLSTPDLQFTIVPESLESMRRMKDRMSILSKERIVEELNKILVCAKPSKAFELMDSTGLLDYILPQLSALKGVESIEGMGHKENFSHSLLVLDNVCAADNGPEPNLWLRWAALLHDIGKPASKKYVPGTGWTFHGHDVIGAKMIPKIFTALKMPLNEKMKYVQKLVRLHLRPIALVDDGVTDSAVRRLLFDAGDDIDDLMLLCNADITSKNPAKVARLHENFELVKRKLVEVEQKDEIRNFKNPVTGEYIMEVYGIGPCKEIGVIKEFIKEAILDGVIGNNFPEADALMRQKASELGLHAK